MCENMRPLFSGRENFRTFFTVIKEKTLRTFFTVIKEKTVAFR